MDISPEILSWREGNPITLAHRQALASFVAEHYTLSTETEAQELENMMKLSDDEISEFLAIMIATVTKMNLQSFLLAFPKIATESKNSAIETFIKLNFTQTPD
jgi:succinate dehydrogenase flavin-adding protein (antitoxin of CptAB toxin-antitoxin module)